MVIEQDPLPSYMLAVVELIELCFMNELKQEFV